MTEFKPKGRPKGRVYTEAFSVVMTADQKQLIRQAAQLTGHSFMEYMRIVAVRAAKKDIEEAGG
jgi:uncharacterized protein (DUF1778 family)